MTVVFPAPLHPDMASIGGNIPGRIAHERTLLHNLTDARAGVVYRSWELA